MVPPLYAVNSIPALIQSLLASDSSAGRDPDDDTSDLLQVVYVDDLLDPAFISRFLAAGRAGLLNRVRQEPERTESNTRARMASLRALANFVGWSPPAHDGPPSPPRELLGHQELSAVLTGIAGPARGIAPSPLQVRLGALLACMWLQPQKSVDLALMTVERVLVDSSGVPYAVVDSLGKPQAVARSFASAIHEWLLVRGSLVGLLSGGAHGMLWVTVQTVPAPGAFWPAGLPLHARGIQRAYSAAVRELNVERVGDPGFPLPASLDLLRRTLLEGVRTDPQRR